MVLVFVLQTWFQLYSYYLLDVKLAKGVDEVVEQVGAAGRLAGVTAAVEQHYTEDRQRDAVRRQTALPPGRWVVVPA